MLIQVDVTTMSGSVLSLPLEDVEAGIIVQEIKGLDPVKATLVSSSFAGQDGEQFYSSRREARNLVMTLGLAPDYVTDSVQDLRRRVYDYLMPKKQVLLTFTMDDGLNVNILGIVESLETPLFSREPAIDVSIMCYDPDFVDPDVVSLTGSSTNEITEITVEYDGTVETGVQIEMDINQTLDQFTIYHRAPDGSTRTLTFVNPMVNGEVIKIDTRPGTKQATSTLTGTTTSVLYGISPQSNWLQLEPGTNYLRFYVNKVTPVTWSLDYFTRYGGL